MNSNQSYWKEGDLWTNERGVTFRLERHAVPVGPVYIWVTQHYQIPQAEASRAAHAEP